MKKALILMVGIYLGLQSVAQVNLQTGSSNFGLPIFNWQDDNSRLNTVVALNYSSGNGLRVNDVASNIGQGWSLISGGVISRIQAGEPDDQKPREGTPEDETKYPAGYLYDVTDPSEGCPGALVKYPIYEDKNHVYKQHNVVQADKERDKFAFQFNGKSGLFVLDRGGGGSVIMLSDSKIKVWFTRDESMTCLGQGVRTTINAFYLQDENGLIYKFTQKEFTKVLKTNYADGSLTGSQIQPNFKDNNVYHEGMFDNTGIANPYTVNSWYLEEIEDALTHRKVTFTYVTRNVNAHAGTSFTYYEEKNYSIISYATSITYAPKVSTILYPDGHLVTFNYGDQRADLNGDYVLSGIDITYQGRNLAKYLLTQSYFIQNRYGIPVSDYQKKAARLCLVSVKKIGVDLKSEDAPYVFDYNTGSSTTDDIVPPPFFYKKDIWGYYNGDNSKDCYNNDISSSIPVNELSNGQIRGLCFNRDGSGTIVLNPKPGYAANGLLKKISYPTGGTLAYTYAQNTAVVSGQTINIGGVHVSQTSATDGGYSNDCTNPVVTNYNYVTEGTNPQSSLWGYEAPDNVLMTVSHYEPELKKFHYGFRHSCWPLGCCIYKYQYPGILSRQAAVSLTSRQQTMETISAVMDVLNVVFHILDIITVATGGNPLSLILDIIGDIVNIVITCFSDFSRDYYSTAHYNYDLKSSNPLPSEFRRVEVTESSGQNGKVVTEFTSDAEYPVWEPSNDAYSSKQRYATWAYGLPLKTTVFDASGNKVRQTENVYDFLMNDFRYMDKWGNWYGGYSSCKCLVTKSSSQRNTDWEDPNKFNPPYTPNITQTNGDMRVDKYFIKTGRAELKTTYERVFQQGQSTLYAETETDYIYNGGTDYSGYNYDLRSVSTRESNGSWKSKYFYYNREFWDASGNNTLSTLAQNNFTSVPVKTVTYENSAVLDESVTEYTTTTNGDIKPFRTLKRNFASPYYGGQFYVSPGDPGNPTDLTETQLLTYNNSGKLIGIKDEGNRTVTNFYDYNDKFVTASVVNADVNTDKCAYTSFETSNTNGWTLNGTASYVNGTSITGSFGFNLNGSNGFSSNLNAAKPYRLSFWSTTSTITVSGGATLVKSAPTLNGFTYYEYNISQGTTSITVSGTGVIDELRLYPSSGRMRSITYDPLIGKTSECDENNRVIYYEYDEKGRLRFIKDDAKNILKMYEYNIATRKTTGPCVQTFYNKLVSETFTKNNCGAGFIGSKVTYTIPANIYSSTISQAVADMQAQAELDRLGQSYANTNGNCIQVFKNVLKSKTFSKEGCPVGYKGTSVTYTVPADKYSSIISQADADAKAQNEIDANGQAYANKPGVASCIIDTEPDYEGTGPTQCQFVNGEYHIFYFCTDINPNSATYNQTMWKDGGVSPSCNPSPCTFTMASGFYSPTNGISSGGGVVSFYLVFYPVATMQPGTTYYLASISGSCRPSAVRTINYSTGGRNWIITIYPGGTMDVYLQPGSPAVNPYTTIAFSSLNYNL